MRLIFKNDFRMFGLYILFFLSSFFSINAKVFITPEEALKDAFPNSQIEKKRIYLSLEDLENLKNKLKFQIKHRFYSFYVAKDNLKQIQGYAILHTDIVRTKEMSLMIILNSNFELSKFYLISFYEPLEYKPTERWLNLFINKKDKLILGIDIPIIAGATLTSRTVYQFVELTKELVNYLK